MKILLALFFLAASSHASTELVFKGHAPVAYKEDYSCGLNITVGQDGYPTFISTYGPVKFKSVLRMINFYLNSNVDLKQGVELVQKTSPAVPYQRGAKHVWKTVTDSNGLVVKSAELVDEKKDSVSRIRIELRFDPRNDSLLFFSYSFKQNLFSVPFHSQYLECGNLIQILPTKN